MGTAGRAQAHLPPGTTALKSEPGAARLVRRAGRQARAPPRVGGGAGAEHAGALAGVGPAPG